MADNAKDNDEKDEFTPPDGGIRAWLVMFAAFFCQGIIFGTLHSYGVIYKNVYDDLKARNASGASSKAALVGSLTLGTTFLGASIAGILSDILGINWTVALGGTLTTGGLLLSSMFTTTMEVLYFSYGIVFGLGASCIHTPSLAILGHYFKKYLGRVNGFVTTGASVFMTTMPFLIAWFLDAVALGWTYRLLALIFCMVFLCAYIFQPVEGKKKTRFELKNAINVSVWKNKRFVVWASVLAFSVFGLFVPHVHIIKFVDYNFGEGYDGKVALMCMAAFSGVGRLFFGVVADYGNVNRLYLQQFTYFCMGIAIVIFPFTKRNFPLLLVISSCLGFCNVTLAGPIAYDLCGKSGATQALGYLLAMAAVPLMTGPFLVGKLYDYTQSYDLAFHLAGLPPIIGSLALFAVRFVEHPESSFS